MDYTLETTKIFRFDFFFFLVWGDSDWEREFGHAFGPMEWECPDDGKS